MINIIFMWQYLEVTGKAHPPIRFLRLKSCDFFQMTVFSSEERGGNKIKVVYQIHSFRKC